MKRRYAWCVPLRVGSAIGMGAAFMITAASVAAFDITACGAVIEENETGVLTADLACPDSGGSPVLIFRNGTLDLNGFTLSYAGETLPDVGAPWKSAIRCDAACAVISSAVAPGHVVGVGNPKTIGIAMDGVRLRMDNVEIAAFAAGVRSPTPGSSGQIVRARMTDVVLRDLSQDAVFFLDRIKGRNVTIAGATGAGLFAVGTVRVQGFTCVEGSYTCAGSSTRLRVDDGIVTGATFRALFGSRVKVTNSDVRGSAIDIASDYKPIIKDSLCDTSENRTDGGNWGVCALD